ncbi:MAG: LPXTG cell wall anchor domain-containing protein, partial [Lachnospiraceae bacterium]|nr:LPXTG cell wall anchor domain-containing protein [Lachnospiraceae bacterium]
NLNETDGNKIVAYPVERTETQNDNRKKVEAVLTKMGVLDTVTANVKTFVRNKNNSDLQKYLGKVYPDVNFDSDDWYIDWYVMKTQDNGIHVDGVFVTIYDLEEWTVVYNFVKVVDDEDEIVYSVPLDDTYSVRKGDKPDFTNDNVIETVSDITDKYTQDQCTLRVNEDGSKFIFVENKETNKKTIEIFYELKEEKIEQPGDPVNPNNPSDDPVNPQNPSDEPVDPQNPSEDPKDEPKQNDEPVVPFIIIPSFIDDEPEEPVAEEIPVDEPKTPEAAPEEEEIPVEEPGTPEGAPVEEEPEEEEIPVEVPTTPEGAPEEEEEEDIDVEIPETPEGDVLPQTGVASAAVFFGFGAGFIAIGAAVIGKFARKEEI